MWKIHYLRLLPGTAGKIGPPSAWTEGWFVF